MARLSRPLPAAGAVALIALAGSLLLAGCSSQTPQALAQQACGQVDHSIALYQRAQQSPGSAHSALDATEAVEQLRTGALPLAAQAANGDGQWQALVTILEESSRVPESSLIASLQQQCRLAAQGLAVAPRGTKTSGNGSATTVGPSSGSGSATTVGPSSGSGSATTVRSGTG